MKLSRTQALLLSAFAMSACDADGGAPSLPAADVEGSVEVDRDAGDAGVDTRSCPAGEAEGICLPEAPRGRSEAECGGGVAGSAWFAGGGVCLPQLTDWECPDGWVTEAPRPLAEQERVDGVSLPSTCAPAPADACPPGTYAAPSGCRAVGSACPADQWPDEAAIRRRAPGFDGRVVYAAPPAPGGAGETLDGSRDAPYADLSEALRVAGEDGIVALARGRHEGGLVLRARTAIVGACAGDTVMSDELSTSSTRVIEVRGAGALVADVTLSARRDAISFRASGSARSVVVAGAGTDALSAAGASVDVALEDVVVEEAGGSALSVTSGASATLSHARLASFATWGVFVDERAELVASDLRLSCKPAAQDEGIGVAVYGGGRATFAGVAIESCSVAGAYASDPGTALAIEDAWLADAPARTMNTIGVAVSAGATVRLDRAAVTGVAVGVLADDGADAHVADSVFSDSDGTDVVNPHVMSLGGAAMALQRVVLLGGDLGIWSEGPAHVLDSVVLGQRSAATDVNPSATGVAVWVSTGTFEAERVVIAEAEGAGLLATEDVGAVMVRDLWVDGAAKGGLAVGLGTRAMFSIGMADVDVIDAERVLATDVPGLALAVQLCPSVHLSDVVSVAGPALSSSGGSGVVQISQSGEVSVERLRVEEPRSVALHLSRVARGSLQDVDAVRPEARADDGGFGRGVQVDQSQVSLTRVRVDDAADAGVYLLSSTSTLADLLVTGTRGAPCSPIPSACVEAGHGVVVDAGVLSLSDFMISGSSAAGIVVAGDATIDARAGLIAENLIGVSASGGGLDLDTSFHSVRLRDNVVDVSSDSLPVPVAIVPTDFPGGT